MEVTYPNGRKVSYKYDEAGNRTSVTDNSAVTNYSTNNMNQYTNVGNENYEYDDDGNMISRTDAGSTTEYTYDAENRLVQVVSSSGETWQYTYDALGNRVTVNHNGSVTRYVHDPIGLVDIARTCPKLANFSGLYDGQVKSSRHSGSKTASKLSTPALFPV